MTFDPKWEPPRKLAPEEVEDNLIRKEMDQTNRQFERIDADTGSLKRFWQSVRDDLQKRCKHRTTNAEGLCAVCDFHVLFGATNEQSE